MEIYYQRIGINIPRIDTHRINSAVAAPSNCKYIHNCECIRLICLLSLLFVSIYAHSTAAAAMELNAGTLYTYQYSSVPHSMQICAVAWAYIFHIRERELRDMLY